MIEMAPAVKPFFDDGHVTIYHGDCRDVLPELGLDVAVVIADPPYEETTLEWDRWQDGWVDAVSSAVGERTAMWCFGSWRMFWAHQAEFAAWSIAQDLVTTDEIVTVWEKHNGSSSAADRFRRVHEFVVQFYRGPWDLVRHQPVYTRDATARVVRRKTRPAQWGEIGSASYQSYDGGPRLMRSVIRCRSEHGRAVHPTQKPLGVLAPLIEYSTSGGGLVLDPFMGSGSTLVAARELGRRAVGIEANEDYCAIAVERLRQGSLWMDAI